VYRNATAKFAIADARLFDCAPALANKTAEHELRLNRYEANTPAHFESGGKCCAALARL
jgi:hypothetical protein